MVLKISIDKIVKALEYSDAIIGIFLDFPKAFDKAGDCTL